MAQDLHQEIKIMKIQSFIAVFVLALMMPLAVSAADLSAPAVGGPAPTASGPDNENATVGEAIDQTADAIKALLLGKKVDTLKPVLINRHMTANGIIGATVINTSGARVATVKDIIIDGNGRAVMIVVSDGGLLGIGGKVAAFDFNGVVALQPDGKVVMTLSQEMISHAANFSYDQQDWAKSKVIPADSMSVKALLKGNVLDSDGRKVATIDNIYLRDNDVSQVIVSFDKKLGMGGNVAALDYDDLQMVRKNKQIDFQLTPKQTAIFRDFEKSVTN
jgi:sporulation protein YlmC with PRC-barrel domain